MTHPADATPAHRLPAERLGAVRRGLRQLGATPDTREVLAAAGVTAALAEIDEALHELSAILAAPPRADATAD